MTNAILRVVGMLFGLALCFTGVDMAIQAYEAPAPLQSLTRVDGTLKSVSGCTTGRNAKFRYVVKSGQSTLEVVDGCPNATYQALRSSIDEPINLLYKKRRGFLFAEVIDVYELRLTKNTLLSYNQAAEHDQNVRWYAVALFSASALVGLALFKSVIQRKGRR